MKKIMLSLSLLLGSLTMSYATTPDSVRYNCIQQDTAFITSIIDLSRTTKLSTPAERIVFVARQFMGVPYQSSTLEGDPEMLTINMSAVDCTTFVENVLALAMTIAEDTTTYKDFEKRLQSIRYRNGEISGYSSRLHYVSDWIADNSARGNFSEVTQDFPRTSKKTICLDYITTHRNSYSALKENDEEYALMQEIEKGYHNYTYTYIPTQMLASKQMQRNLKNGDIVLLTTNIKGLDVTHMGIIVMQQGQPYLLHASSRSNQVAVEKQSLYNYLTTNRKMNGIRIVRL